MTPVVAMAALAVTAGGALWTALQRADEKAQRGAVAAAALAALLTSLNLTLAQRQASALGLGLRVDALSAPLLALVAWVALAVVLAAPHRADGAPLHQRLAKALGSAAGVQLVLATDHAALLALGWLLALLGLAYPSRQPGLRGQLACSGLVAGALAWLALLQHTPWISQWHAALSADHAAALFALLAIGAGARAALLPMQSWWLPMFEDGPLSAGLPLMSGATAAYLLARLALPLLPEAAERGMPLLAGLALATVAYAAVLALAQTHLRRLAGTLALLQSALQVVALAAADHTGQAGVWLQAVTSGLAVSGFALLAEAVRARTGTAQAPQLGGLVLHAPRLSWLLLLFGLAAVGLPGTLGFVGEDLIVHGLVEHHPWMAAAVVAATALAAIALIRVWSLACLGPAPRRSAGLDLLPREQAAAALLALPLLALGLWPRALVAEASRAAMAIAAPAPDTAHAGRPATHQSP